jgi:hypothetical protein
VGWRNKKPVAQWRANVHVRGFGTSRRLLGSLELWKRSEQQGSWEQKANSTNVQRRLQLSSRDNPVSIIYII